MTSSAAAASAERRLIIDCYLLCRRGPTRRAGRGALARSHRSRGARCGVKSAGQHVFRAAVRDDAPVLQTHDALEGAGHEILVVADDDDRTAHRPLSGEDALDDENA